MGLFEKGRFKDFLVYVVEFDLGDPSTYKGVDPNGPTTELLKKYKLEKGTQDFLGHALALYKDELWLNRPAKDTIDRVKLYQESLAQHGKSPYLYPLYGLGDLPQAFARLSAIYGGTYMLNKPIEGYEFDSKGRITGVTSEGQTVKCSKVIADPSYFPEKVKQVGQIVRCICILDHTIPNTSNSESSQIILPQNQYGRQSDIYISCVSFAHNVAPPGKYIVMISTTCETNDPRSEVQPAIQLLGPVLHTFYSVKPIFEPINDPNVDGIFISNSYDASSHFESIADDVIRIYQLFTGKSDVSNILEPAPDDDPNEQTH
jgi:Rab GDP dissociation inhibitor